MLTNFKILKFWIQGKDPFFEAYFKGKKVLDLGCGRGDFLMKDPKNFEGIDVNKNLIKEAGKRGLKVKLGDVTKIPFPDNSFEGVHCVNVIEHLYPDQALKMLSEARRVLKTKGTFLLSSELATPKIWNTFGHIRPYPPLAIKKVLREDIEESFGKLEGLKIKNIFYIGQDYKNKIFKIIFRILGLFFPFGRRKYIMILEKSH